jgi:hypothetical protein
MPPGCELATTRSTNFNPRTPSLGLRHRCERRIGVPYIADIVESDDGYVLWNPKSVPPRCHRIDTSAQLAVCHLPRRLTQVETVEDGV